MYREVWTGRSRVAADKPWQGRPLNLSNKQTSSKQRLPREQLKEHYETENRYDDDGNRGNRAETTTYTFCTNGVVFTLGCATFPIAKMPPPRTVSKQWAKIFLTLRAAASCDSIDESAWPNPRIPSRAWLEDPKSPPSWAPHLQNEKSGRINGWVQISGPQARPGALVPKSKAHPNVMLALDGVVWPLPDTWLYCTESET